MQMLVERIETLIQTEKCCFVRPDELRQIWPSVTDEDRERLVRDFAREHGWQVFSHNRVLGAMIVRGAVRGK